MKYEMKLQFTPQHVLMPICQFWKQNKKQQLLFSQND